VGLTEDYSEKPQQTIPEVDDAKSDLPEGFDPSQPLDHKKNEAFARNLAANIQRTKAYVLAGFKAKDAMRQSHLHLRRNPQIVARADHLALSRLGRKAVEETAFAAKEWCLAESLDLIASAKLGDPVLFKGEPVYVDGEMLRKPDRTAWIRGIDEIARIEKLLVQRHEIDTGASSDMGPDAFFHEVRRLVEATGGSLDRNAFDALFGFTGPPIEAVASRSEATDGEVVSLQTPSEAARAPRQGGEVHAAPLDGWQPARENRGWSRGDGDARDGDLSVVVAGDAIRSGSPTDLVRGDHDPDGSRRDPGEAIRPDWLARNWVGPKEPDRKYDTLPGRSGSHRLRNREEDEWDEDEDPVQGV